MQKLYKLFYLIFLFIFILSFNTQALAQGADGSLGGTTPDPSTPTEPTKADPAPADPASGTGASTVTTPTPTPTPTPTSTPGSTTSTTPVNPSPVTPDPVSVPEEEVSVTPDGLIEESTESTPAYPFNFGTLMLALGAGAVLGALGFFALRSNKNKKDGDPCSKLKESRDKKQTELMETVHKFSLQETILRKLEEEVKNKKEAVEKYIINRGKDKILDALDNDSITNVVKSGEKIKELYDDLNKKYEKAREILEILRKRKAKLTSELDALEVSYKQCMINTAVSTKSLLESGKKITLPDVKKVSVFIFHGTAGHPKENWFPWLKEKLEERGYEVFVPQFPTPKGQSLKAWGEILEEYGKYINEDSIFVGHSLGGMFLLRLLEKIEYRVKGAMFVGTPVGVKPILNYTNDYNFGGFNFKWDKIKDKAEKFYVFHSDNDPYVGIDNGKKLAKELGVKLTLIKNAGHFNTKSGYTKFDELFEKIIKI